MTDLFILDSSISSKLFFLEVRSGSSLESSVTTEGNQSETNFLFILDCSISSKLFFLEVQLGSLKLLTQCYTITTGGKLKEES